MFAVINSAASAYHLIVFVLAPLKEQNIMLSLEPHQLQCTKASECQSAIE